jgi:hypothetical protein
MLKIGSLALRLSFMPFRFDPNVVMPALEL